MIECHLVISPEEFERHVLQGFPETDRERLKNMAQQTTGTLYLDMRGQIHSWDFKCEGLR